MLNLIKELAKKKKEEEFLTLKEVNIAIRQKQIKEGWGIERENDPQYDTFVFEMINTLELMWDIEDKMRRKKISEDVFAPFQDKLREFLKVFKKDGYDTDAFREFNWALANFEAVHIDRREPSFEVQKEDIEQ